MRRSSPPHPRPRTNRKRAIPRCIRPRRAISGLSGCPSTSSGAHIGVDVASGVVHSLTGTAANAADINQMAAVLRGQEKAVFADAGYTGAAKCREHAEREVSWNIAVKRSIIKALPKALRDRAEPEERALAPVRAWVEHPFHIVKNRFRHKKLRYRGLAKNT